ncbi:MAG: hypothetical protein ABL936_02795 [Aestuariivirga sp.]
MRILSWCFKILRIRASADPQPIENRAGEPDKPQSSLSNLTENNPHVIIASLLSSKPRK